MKITLDDIKRQNGELVDEPIEPAPKPEEKRNFKQEIEQIMSLHGKERLTYLWDYYSRPVIITIIAAAAIISLIYNFINQSEDCLAGTTLDIVTTDLTFDSSYLNSYLEYAGFDPDEYVFSMRSGMYLTEDASENYTTYMTLATLVAAQDLDFILCAKNDIEYLSTTGYAADLEQVLSPETFEKYSDRMLYGTIGSEDTAVANRPVALEVTDSHITKALQFINENYYLVFITNSTHTDQFDTFLSYLLEYQPEKQTQAE
ncbi:MAG: hypothetical protein ACI4C1_07420 [Lachnospiraceae bacterium]